VTRTIKIATCNFELNGAGDRQMWEQMHDRLAGLQLDVLMRQEVWNADPEAFDGGAWGDAAADVLGMQGWYGPRCCTALYVRPGAFVSVRGWPHPGGMWELPPTLRKVRVVGLPEQAAPLLLGSLHFNYGSVDLRKIEAQWATTYADKWERRGDRLVKISAVLGADTNSYPEPGTPGDVPLPVPEHIKDKPHVVHRSRLITAASGRQVRVMDIDPDKTLRKAGLEDPARYLAVKGHREAVAPTMEASSTHGPRARVDRFYVSEELLPAVERVEVVEMHGLSDHHTVVVHLNRDTLGALLLDPPTRTAP
jgi:hypothetical protein